MIYPTKKVNKGEMNSNLLYFTQYMQNIIISQVINIKNY